MGIPSYFSHIIKNHSHVIKKNIDVLVIERLYMDCNSILYDSYHEVYNNNDNYSIPEDAIHQCILEKTVQKIDEYIRRLKPTHLVYIAFDGPAPVAKMEQQRNRRYKSWFQTTYSSSLETETQKKIPSSIFTPGTIFMQKLSVYMKNAFKTDKLQQSIILATPDEPGEGEHKLYEHLRKNPLLTNAKNIAIYGLDADLIMLSLFHLSYTNNIFVVREAPEFMKSTTIDTSLWGLDIAQFGRSIANDMACSYPDNHRMYDYVFLCFLLGNDFLPHFPALNIRTYGIQRLLDTYRMTIGNRPNTFLLTKTPNLDIHWKSVSVFISALARNEYSFIKDEYAFRTKFDYLQGKMERMEKDGKNGIDKKEIDDLIESVPVIFRQEESYICPSEPGWEKRYYSRLNGIKTNTKEICINYLEGLEWVCKYYICGCPDWKWKYKYMYPPLLKDLAPVVPNYRKEFFSTTTKNISISPYVQLAYVLPRNQLFLLPKEKREILLTKYGHLYPEGTNLEFKWAFCRYLWESHVCLPEISLHILEKWEKELNK